MLRNLRIKIDSLEAKIVSLNDQIDFYKHKQFSLASGIESDFTEFMNARHFFRNDFVQELKDFEGQHEKAHQRFLEVKNLEGPYGKYRAMLMKKWIRTIIENMIPEALMIRFQVAKYDSNLSEESYSHLLRMNK